MRGWLALAMAGLLLGGCVSAQLNGNTLDLAASVGDLQTQQVVRNLSRFIDDPDAIPAQALLLAGFVQARDSGTVSTSIPLDLINKFSRDIGGSGGVEWTENWYVVPVTDGNDLRRLRALYRFAVYGNQVMGKPSPERAGPYDLDRSYASADDAAPRPRAFTGEQAADASAVLHTGWLYWVNSGLGTDADEPPPPHPGEKLYSLGHAGGHTLFTTNRAYWSDFVFAVLRATPATRSTGARPALGGQ